MESLIDRITIDPQICNGKPVVRGMRITVKTVLDFLAAGETIENLLKAYPYLQREDIYACIHYRLWLWTWIKRFSKSLLEEEIFG